LGRTAAATRSGSVVSTKVVSMPNRANTVVNRRYVPPYTSSETTRWSPVEKSINTLAMAAMPEEKAKAAAPPSSRAAASSSAARVGLPERA
jgi:hypothetical protein